MIVTKNAVYLHVPKTGGHWMRRVLESKTEYWIEHGVPTEKDMRPYVFSFVRNPWDWHVSGYFYLASGSEVNEIKYKSIIDSLLNVSTKDHAKGFDAFLNLVCHYNEAEIKKWIQFSKLRKMVELSKINMLHNPVLMHQALKRDVVYATTLNWLGSNTSLYEVFYNRYCKVSTHIGKYENLRNDFLEFTRMAGDLDPVVEKAIIKHPGVNVTKKRVDYRKCYNDSQIELVYNTTRFLDQYGYTFK